MVTEREALKLALEALEGMATWVEMRPKTHPWDTWKRVGPAITAIREALAQPEQEHVIDCPRCGHCCPQPEQEPVATWENKYGMKEWQVHALRAGWSPTPPHRKPLTDEEIDKLPWEPHESNPMTFAEGLRYFARAIEAAHGIKE